MPPAACMLINRSRACWYVCLVHWQVCVPHSTALQSMPAACGAHTAPRHMASSAVERPLLPVRAMAAPVTQTQRPRQHQPARNSRGNDRRLPCQWRRPRLAGQHKPREVHHLWVQGKAAPGASALGARRPMVTPGRQARIPRRRPQPTWMRGASRRRARRRRRTGPAGAAGRAASGAARAAARRTAKARPPMPSWRPRCSTRSPTSCSLVRACRPALLTLSGPVPHVRYLAHLQGQAAVGVCGACEGRRPMPHRRQSVMGACLVAVWEVGAAPLLFRAGRQRH